MPISSIFLLQDLSLGLPSISVTKNGVFFSVNLLKKMGNPKFVQVYISYETREMAIVPCKQNDDCSVQLKVSGTKYAKIYNRELVHQIAVMCGKTFDTIKVTVLGKFAPEGKCFIFDIGEATQYGKRTNKQKHK